MANGNIYILFVEVKIIKRFKKNFVEDYKQYFNILLCGYTFFKIIYFIYPSMCK